MSLTTDTPQEVLLSWYSTKTSLTVDIVGDFAGRELFLVHGESLIRHCLPQSKVDFHGMYYVFCVLCLNPALCVVKGGW